jgi:hypothetical protein
MQDCFMGVSWLPGAWRECNFNQQQKTYVHNFTEHPPPKHRVVTVFDEGAAQCGRTHNFIVVG